MVPIAAFVESAFYVVIASLVIFIAVFWFALNRQKRLLLPFLGSSVFVVALSVTLGIFKTFLISLTSMMLGITIHLLVAAWVLRMSRRIILGFALSHRGSPKS
jgi:hypothetical protein